MVHSVCGQAAMQCLEIKITLDGWGISCCLTFAPRIRTVNTAEQVNKLTFYSTLYSIEHVASVPSKSSLVVLVGKHTCVIFYGAGV